jgi:hypothetical protein
MTRDLGSNTWRPLLPTKANTAKRPWHSVPTGPIMQRANQWLAFDDDLF